MSTDRGMTMNTVLEQIEKARARQGATDLQHLAEYARDKSPAALESGASSRGAARVPVREPR